MKNSKMTKALKTLEKKPLRFKEFQQVIWNIDKSGIVPQGYYCTNIQKLETFGIIEKKNKKIYLTKLGKKNINKPYAMPKELIIKEKNRYYNCFIDKYQECNSVIEELQKVKADNNFLKLQLETAQDLLIGCAREELLKVIESEEFNSQLLEYLID